MTRTETKTAYAICFDFPEAEGDPIFAGWFKGGLGFAPSLATAATECGTVVEVER